MIYTKTGDNGTTSLANGERVSKTDPRIEAYGTADELNSYFGWLRALLEQVGNQPSGEVQSGVSVHINQLAVVQNKLFNLGAALSEAPGEWITDADVHCLETWIDRMQAALPKMKGFVLPYGDETAVRSHICRTVCRRAERRMIESDATPTQRQFINRLSDYLFVLSRYSIHSQQLDEEVWNRDINV